MKRKLRFDSSVQHLAKSDPEEAIGLLQTTLADTEKRIAAQQSRYDSIDLHERLEEIRRRQQAVREMVGVVSEKRRTVEPVFGELKDRLRQLDRWLAELETDDNKKSLGDRVNELNQDVSVIHTRHGALQQSVATLNRFKEELEKAREELAPVRSPETGINPLIAELRVSGDQLTRMLDELESSGDEKLNLRVESLSKAKIEIEQRVAHIDDCFNILDSIRLDFEELRKRQTHLDRSLTAIETDSGGASLVDRQNALNDFIVECRLRLRNLQDISTTLSQFNEELAKSQAGLLPLQAPVYGIEALIGEVNVGHAILSKTLDEIEVKGDESLTSRVETLATNKAEVDQRVSRIFEDFQKLDSMRKNIGEMFTSIRGTLNRIG